MGLGSKVGQGVNLYCCNYRLLYECTLKGTNIGSFDELHEDKC